MLNKADLLRVLRQCEVRVAEAATEEEVHFFREELQKAKALIAKTDIASAFGVDLNSIPSGATQCL